jgi:dolichol kinase
MALKLNPFFGKNHIEFARKSIHIQSILIPIFYKYILQFDKKLTILALLFMVAISIAVELLRLENKTFRKLFNLAFGLMLRKHEADHITGASYLLVSAIVCIAFFPPQIAFLSLAFLSIGDTFAAIIGMNFGKRKFLRSNKSFEGFLACFVTTFVFGIFFIDNQVIFPVIVFFGAITASIAEVVHIQIDDNVKIPILSGIVMCFVYLFV